MWNGEGPGVAASAEELALRDELTGLFNRRLLADLFATRWRPLVAEHGRLSLVMIDLDGFKEVNDSFGHIVGDAVLRATARILRRGFRTDDVVVRYGGDEFVVVLPGVGAGDAARLGERVREGMSLLVDDPEVRAAGVDVAVSFSIGVASVPEDGTLPEEVLERADRRLFVDKRRRNPLGRNRWRAAGVLGLLAAGVLAASLVGPAADEAPPPAGPVIAATPAAAFPVREAELLGEIESLRQELSSRREAHAISADAAQDQRAITALQERIRELEASLSATRAPAGEPSAPAPAAAPTAVPEAATAMAAAASAHERPAPTAAAPGRPTAGQPGPAVVLPLLQHYEPPRYPDIARRMRREAVVELRVAVDRDGRVVSVGRIGPPAGYGFDEAARDAAFKARFAPGTIGGVAVTMEAALTVRFRLSEPR